MQNTEQERHSGLKLIVVLAYIILLTVVNIFGSNDEIAVNTDNPNMVVVLKLLQAFGVFILFICPAILFAVFWTKPGIRYIGIITRPAFLTMLISSIGMLLAMPLINWLAEFNQQMQLPEILKDVEAWMQLSEERMAVLTEVYTRGTSVGVLLLNLFVIAFMAALSEELFFRGIIQKNFVDYSGNKHFAVWISAIVFSAFHLQFYGFIPRMLMGAFLGYLFVWSGSIWPSILAHFVNNGAAVVLVWLANRGVIGAEADKIGIQPGEWVYVVACAITVAICLLAVYYIEKKRKKRAGEPRSHVITDLTEV